MKAQVYERDISANNHEPRLDITLWRQYLVPLLSIYIYIYKTVLKLRTTIFSKANYLIVKL